MTEEASTIVVGLITLGFTATAGVSGAVPGPVERVRLSDVPAERLRSWAFGGLPDDDWQGPPPIQRMDIREFFR